MSDLPNYDAWKLSGPPEDEGWQEFLGKLTVKEEDEYRQEYTDKLIAEGMLDDELGDYDEDKFWEWVREEKYL